MKTVLVTGASGFVGGHVVEALARSGIRPRCLVRRTSRLDRIEAWSPELVFGDVTSPADLETAVAGVDGIVHCAGVTRALSLAEYMRVNADGCGNLYRACLARNPAVRRIVHLGSLAAWGPSAVGRPVQEGHERRPVSDYGSSKLAGQRIAEDHMDRLPIVVLAPPAVYGPYDVAFRGLFACVKRGVAPAIGRKERWVSLIYAQDLARAVFACLESEKAAGQEYLLEDGHPHTWREVSDAIGQAMQTSSVRVRIPLMAVKAAGAVVGYAARCTGKPSFLDRDRLKDFLQPAWTCSSAKIRAELGFAPQYTLEQGVAETCRWYTEHDWL
jgi:nucleoside-diphosphate-sugar epimerase